jgi:hypothetical protein
MPIKGDKYCQIKNINSISTINEYRSRKTSAIRNLDGKILKSILDPSSGGSGIRLKTASKIFTKIIVLEMR